KDADGRYVFVNRTMSRHFGEAAAGWVGQTDRDLWPADMADRLRADDLAAMDDPRGIEVEETVSGPDGTRSHWLTCKFPVASEHGQVLLAGMSLNVTEWRRAEAERDRLLLLPDQANVLMRDADDRITFWNRGAQRLYGFTPEEALGRVSHE